MNSLLAFLDGKKRYLLLVIFALQALGELLGYGTIVGVTKAVISMLGWTPTDGLVSYAIVAQLVAAAYAIYDGWRKDREARSRLNR